MIKTKLYFLIFALILLGNSLASPSIIMPRQLMGSVGETVSDKAQLYILNGSLGEPIAAEVTLGTDYRLGSGYWAGGGIVANDTTIYLPVIIK